jgi:hypothetical protein
MKLKLTFSLLTLAFAASAQQPPVAAPATPGRGPGAGRGIGQPALRSVEILDDNRVTFRVRAVFS